ncbi:MAG: SDR family oxidoreductase [Acidimicrobiales bacterium]|jgi:short-subunit dehydrogenase|nr:SDR family oxidoreductase [Acidimicrobiales bacterium]
MDQPWSVALVTGASSGIGEAVARELAARRVPTLVVTARRADPLARLADELAAAHGTKVDVVAADLADAAGRAAVAERLAATDVPVDLLVNNAGFGTSGPFAELDPEAEERMVAVNVVALQQLTRAALPGMLERGRGSVLNIASIASLVPMPTMATYAATKAFVASFSESLHEETRGTGVSVSAALVGFTRTEFAGHLPEGSGADGLPGFVWMTPEDVARDAVDGAQRGQALVVPGVGYRVATAAIAPVPRTVRRRAVGMLRSIIG